MIEFGKWLEEVAILNSWSNKKVSVEVTTELRSGLLESVRQARSVGKAFRTREEAMEMLQETKKP